MTSEQATLAPSGDGLYPPLEYLHRISHGNVTVHSDPLSTEPRAPPPAVHQPSVPVISQHSLPTYRQANVSRETVTSSSHPLSEPAVMESALPDILNSHMLPPTRQHRQHRNHRGRAVEGTTQTHPHHHSRPHPQHRRSRTRSTSTTQTQEGTCKEPCVKCIATVTSFRWVLIVLSVLGVCCVVTGIVLAAVRSAGNSFLFLAIMFIGEYSMVTVCICCQRLVMSWLVTFTDCVWELLFVRTAVCEKSYFSWHCHDKNNGPLFTNIHNSARSLYIKKNLIAVFS